MNVKCIFWIGLFTMNLHSFRLRTNILNRAQKVALVGCWQAAEAGSGRETIFINLINFANFHNNLAILTLCKDKRNNTYSKPIKWEIVRGFVHSIGTQGKHYLWHFYHYFSPYAAQTPKIGEITLQWPTILNQLDVNIHNFVDVY